MTAILRGALRVVTVSASGFALVALSGGPAAAADAISVSPDVSTVTTNQTLKISAKADPSLNGGTVRLTVKDPAGTSHTVASATRDALNSTTLTWSFNTACPSYPSAPCSGYAPAINGSWQVAMGSATRTLTLAVPPAQVQGVTASADQSRVTISWEADVEADLRAYDVLTSDGHAVASGIDPGQACAGGSCAVVIDFGPQASGTYAFIVRAERASCPSCSGTVSSDSAPSNDVTITQPTPSSDPSSGGASSGGASSGTAGSGGSSGTAGAGGGSSAGRAGGSTSGGTTGSAAGAPRPGGKSGRSLLDTSVRRFVAGRGLALPPPHLNLPSVQTVLQPLPDGTYKPTLAYPEQVIHEAVRQPAHRPLAEVTTTLTHVVQMPALWRSIGAAVLLLLIAAHLRAWLARTDQP